MTGENGRTVVEVSLGPYRLEVATEFGPRITSLRWKGGPELLARLGPETVIDHAGGTYRFHGGHRLWAAPEVPAITYATDEHPCEVAEQGDKVFLSAPADDAGLEKTIAVSLDGDNIVVDHHIGWSSPDGGAVAPWAITQFPLGGSAILPLVGAETAPLANRYLVLWPYTRAEDPRVTVTDSAVILEAAPGDPVKFGSGPTPGRLGYLRDGVLFIKESEGGRAGVVPDFGAVNQVYVGQGFCELETVGTLTERRDVDRAVLRERWAVTECPEPGAALEMVLGDG